MQSQTRRQRKRELAFNVIGAVTLGLVALIIWDAMKAGDLRPDGWIITEELIHARPTEYDETF